MTEKVVSLSSGLVLGAAFALCLGIGASQISSSPLHMDYPALPDLIGLNDLQSFHTPSTPTQDTTPAISVSPPSSQGTGRIIRIATVSETTDPILTAASGADIQDEFIPKSWVASEDPKTGNTLQQMHLQHSYIASASETYDHISLGQVARQTNFASIAISNSRNGNQAAGNGDQPPTGVDSKPKTTGTPSLAQNNPGSGAEGAGDEPSITASSPRPSSPDDLTDDRREAAIADHYNPHGHHSYGAIDPRPNGHHTDPHGPQIGFQQNHRPETD